MDICYVSNANTIAWTLMNLYNNIALMVSNVFINMNKIVKNVSICNLIGDYYSFYYASQNLNKN